MLDQKGDEAHKGIQVVVAFGSDDGGAGRRVVLLLGLRPVADLHAHLSAQAEEACDQVIRLQNALLMHLCVEATQEEAVRNRLQMSRILL